jgi:hypothetical protein
MLGLAGAPVPYSTVLKSSWCLCHFPYTCFIAPNVLFLHLQTGARTIRPKVHKNLPEFLREYPAVPQAIPWPSSLSRQPDNRPDPKFDWEGLIAEVLQRYVFDMDESISFCDGLISLLGVGSGGTTKLSTTGMLLYFLVKHDALSLTADYCEVPRITTGGLLDKPVASNGTGSDGAVKFCC